MRQRRSEWVVCHLSCTALHPLKLFVAFADLGDAPAAVHGAVAIGARAGAAVLVVAGGAAVFAFAVGSI